MERKSKSKKETSSKREQKNAPIIADAAIVVMNRELEHNKRTLNDIHTNIGELEVVIEGLKMDGVQLRQNIINSQKNLRAVLDSNYGEGSIIDNDGQTIIKREDDDVEVID